MEKVIGVYLITNPKGKVYVGSSVDIHRRWDSYRKLRCSGQPKLCNSLKKYSPDTHRFEVVEECLEEILLERERYWQEKYRVLEEGLNLKLTSAQERPVRYSKETLQKLSDSHKGIIPTAETLRKRSEALKNKPAWNKGKQSWQTEEHIENLREANSKRKGTKLSEEHIEKIRQSKLGHKQSQETIQKRLDSRAGYTHSVETKEKISKANKGKTPSNKGKKHSPATIAKIRKAALQREAAKRNKIEYGKEAT